MRFSCRTTKAVIHGDKLNTSANGTVIITATIINGIANGIDYTQDFHLERSLGVPTVASADFQVFPNPTRGQLTIDNGQLTIDNIEIYDIYGRKAPLTPPEGGKQLPEGQKLPSFGGGGGGSITIDVSHLQSGIYFLKTNNFIKKIIKY